MVKYKQIEVKTKLSVVLCFILYTIIRADRAALSFWFNGVGTRLGVAHSFITKHPSIRAEAGAAGLRRPDSFVVHDHALYKAVSFLS